MICYMPEIYEDETLYSWFCRCYSHSCYPNYRPVANDLFLPGTSRMDVEFSSHLNEEARAVIEKMYPMEDLILNHTMFKQYARFADCNKRKTALASTISGEGNIHQLLPFPMSKNGERYISYCPVCAKEDRETYGEAYWHRKHLIRNIGVCPKHRCRLIPTNISATGKTTHMFEVAEIVIPYDDAPEFVGNDLEITFADYLSRVFDAPLDLENTISIGVYLNYRMQGTPYLTERTYKRQNTLLLKDFQELYHDWPVTSITKEHQLVKLLTEYRIDFYETCQVGYLLGIPSDELQSPSIPDGSPYKAFSDSVMEFRKTKPGRRKLSEFVGTCHGSANGIVRTSGKNGCDYSDRTKAFQQRWAKLDADMLPKVTALVKQIYHGEGGRPRRVTKTAITKAMGWPENRTNYLPRCRAVIEEYSEPSERYWARESVWAYQVLQEKKIASAICWTNLFDLTNIKKESFIRSFPYLTKYTDAKTAEAIKALVP